MKLEDILPQLQAWFLPEEHKERDLPGGGRWFFVPHQLITQRLNTVCPSEWNTEYSDPIATGDYTVIRCKLTNNELSQFLAYLKSQRGLATLQQ